MEVENVYVGDIQLRKQLLKKVKSETKFHTQIN